MEVAVIVIVEDLYSEEPSKIALNAYFTMVALNAGGRPFRVPSLEMINEEERGLFQQGLERYDGYKRKVIAANA